VIAPGQGVAVPPQGVAVPPQGAAVPPQGVGVPPQVVSVPAQGGLGQSVQAVLPGQAPVQAGPQGAQPLPQLSGVAPEPQASAGQPLPAEAAAGPNTAGPVPAPAPQPWPTADDTSGAGVAVPQAAAQHGTPAPGTPLPPEGMPRAAQPLPAESGAPADPHSTQGRAISVRTLGQGVPFNRQAAQVQQPSATPPPHQPGGSGRRRKLGTPPDPAARTEQAARPEAASRPDQALRPEQAARSRPAAEPVPTPVPAQVPAQVSAPVPAQPSLAGQSRPAQMTEGGGRSYAIGAPDENAAEGPEPLDGPGGAVEVADPPRPQPMDDELPPEPLDNPRRLLVWPAPDVSTQQALSDRGYRPVIVHSREEVDAQIAAFPAALFVDPLTGPITRTALQSLRQAAVAAEVPVLVTAGLGQASRDAAYGADPAVLLKALAPRDSEQHPPRVLLVEEHAEIALALTATLERRGMQVARAASDADAVALAGQFRPNLVVMDLMQVHRRQAGYAGIIDWLRANGQLNRTPLVVYTAAVDQADLPRLASGETVLFLAERSTSGEVQSRIVELLSRIGNN
jgi:CheY-like chemotaxis protein